MMNLTPEQVESATRGEPVRVSVDGSELVLVRADLYQRVKSLVYDDRELTDEDMRSLLAAIGERAGWLDPSMDVYDNYGENRKVLSC